MAVVHIIENLKTRIFDKNGNFRFSFKDFENYQNIDIIFLLGRLLNLR